MNDQHPHAKLWLITTVVVLLLAISGVGYYIYKTKQATQTAATTTATEQTTSDTVSDTPVTNTTPNTTEAVKQVASVDTTSIQEAVDAVVSAVDSFNQ